MSINRLENYVSFYKASGKRVKSDPAAGTTESTRYGQLLAGVQSKVNGSQIMLSTREAVTRSIMEGSLSIVEPSLRSLFEIFRAGFNKSVFEAFRAGSIGSQSHADADMESGGGLDTRSFVLLKWVEKMIFFVASCNDNFLLAGRRNVYFTLMVSVQTSCHVGVGLINIL